MRILEVAQWAHGKFQNSDRKALVRCELYWIYGDKKFWRDEKTQAQQTHSMHSGTAGEVELQASNRRRQRVVRARSSDALPRDVANFQAGLI